MGRGGVPALFGRRGPRPPPGGGDLDPHGADAVVPGGATRADSVRCGLAAVPTSAEVIVVHDAARPLASPGLFDAVIAAVTDRGRGRSRARGPAE
jgi:hypothetical protein